MFVKIINKILGKPEINKKEESGVNFKLLIAKKSSNCLRNLTEPDQLTAPTLRISQTPVI